jgi:hypothetical protein
MAGVEFSWDFSPSVPSGTLHVVARDGIPDVGCTHGGASSVGTGHSV